jgi:hypothetical protein
MLPPEAAPSLAVNVRRAPVDENGAINETIAQLSRGERAGLVVLPSAFTVVNLSRIVEVANPTKSLRFTLFAFLFRLAA